MSNSKGTLYIIATPIGNLDDISARALSILEQVEYIAAEDTRQSKKLLDHYSIKTRVVSHHKFNERKSEQTLLKYLESGSNVALISDAGTPLICDPGSGMVNLCHESGIRVVPVPGASALVATLSVCGFSTDRFVFEGFLPEKKSARIKMLSELKNEVRTMVFYEAPHRILAALDDMIDVFTADRPVFVARELTKKFETLYSGKLCDVRAKLAENVTNQKGEFVVVLKGSQHSPGSIGEINSVNLMVLLLEELPVKKAASIAARVTGESKNNLYKIGLEIQGQKRG